MLITRIIKEKVKDLIPILNSIRKTVRRESFKREFIIDLSELLNSELIQTVEKIGVERLEVNNRKIRISEKLSLDTSIRKNFFIHVDALKVVSKFYPRDFLIVGNVIISDSILIYIKPIYEEITGRFMFRWPVLH